MSGGTPDREIRGRLATLLSLLGSSFDGKALAAAKECEELRRANGVSWSELLAGTDARVATEAAQVLFLENDRLRAEITRLRDAIQHPPMPQPWAESETFKDGAQASLLWCEHVSIWEEDFLGSLLKRRRTLTYKQIGVLQRIREKVDRAVRATWSYRRGAA